MMKIGVLVPNKVGKFTVVPLRESAELAQIPCINEKILISTDEDNELVYKVVDVMFSMDGNVDIFAVPISNITDYMRNLAATTK